MTTTYIRFFHVETHHLPLLLIEAGITLTMWIVFISVPAGPHGLFLNRPRTKEFGRCADTTASGSNQLRST